MQLLLNDHDSEFDTWSWGGEPIYRNGKYCGMTTTTGYGFTFKKQVNQDFFSSYPFFFKRKKIQKTYVIKIFFSRMLIGVSWIRAKFRL